MVEIELHDEVESWLTYRFTKDRRIILLTTFRKQRDNERAQVDRARRAAQACAVDYP